MQVFPLGPTCASRGLMAGPASIFSTMALGGTYPHTQCASASARACSAERHRQLSAKPSTACAGARRALKLLGASVIPLSGTQAPTALTAVDKMMERCGMRLTAPRCVLRSAGVRSAGPGGKVCARARACRA